MPVHTRDPLSLAYNDYKGWIRLEALKWFGDHSGDADFPSHILGGLINFTAKIDAYDAAFAPYFSLIDLANARNKLYSTAADNLVEKLQQIKYALPTIAPDPEILALFNLASKIPTDRDLLQVVAENALTYWATVAIDPLFAPVVGDFVALQSLYDDYIAAQANFIATDDQREATQNLVLSTRAACHEIERKVFTWYRSRHTDGQDEWWTNSPWGKTGGGESGETGTAWDAKPIAKIMKAPYPLNGISAGCEEYSGTTRFDYRIAWAPKGAGVPTMPDKDYMTDVEQPTLLDVELMFGYVYYEWIRARKDGEVSEWSDVASYEWNG